MTPADCQRAADAFEPAYRALCAQRRGLLAMPDGTDRAIPENASASDLPANERAYVVLGVTITDPAQISGAVVGLARRAAQHNVSTGRAQFFRLLPQNAVSAVSPATTLPCRAALIGTTRGEMRIEVAVQA